MAADSSAFLDTLHDLIDRHFSLEEVRTLCFRLNVDYDGLPGDGKTARIRELILALGRRDRLPELVALAERERPNVEWPSVPADFELPDSAVSAAGQDAQNIHHGDVIQGDKIGGDKVSGDKLSLGNIYERSAVAVGRGAQARVSVFNVDIRLLPLVLALVAAVAVLGYLLLGSDIPEFMDAEFNIAVAEFTVLDENGEPVRSEEGLRFAEWLHGRLNRGVAEVLDELFEGTYLVWSPEYTGVISGATPEERERNAEARAKEINAAVIIHGAITPLGDNQVASIEFFVNHESFDEGEEIKGAHNLGDLLPIGNPFDEGLVSVANQPLSARAQGLSLLAVGLAYYSIDDFENAIKYLAEADSDDLGWIASKSTGKHVVKLLLGNAHLRQASRERSPEYLPAAQDYYGASLELDPEYARAEAGLAGVFYLMALGDPFDQESGNDVDLALLNQAEAAFTNALTLENAPASANLENRVQFGLGQIYLVRYALEGADWLERSREQFRAIVTEYEGGNEQIEDLAAHAYARLGLIADKVENNPAAALDLYQLAEEHASPFYKSEYSARIGEIHAAACDIDLAVAAYRRAIGYALQITDQDGFDRYSEKLNSISDADACT